MDEDFLVLLDEVFEEHLNDVLSYCYSEENWLYKWDRKNGWVCDSKWID